MTSENSGNKILSGCGIAAVSGCLLVVVLAVVAYFAASRAMNSFYSSIMNPAPIKRTGPYNFGYESESAHVIIQLPDGYGQLTYMHRPEGTGPAHPADGSRGIALKSAGHKPQEWPLPYYQLRTVRVGLYWHPAKNNMGPFLRFYDATGESVLDLKRNEIAELVRENGKVFIGDYQYNDTAWSTPTRVYDSSGKLIGFETASGKPGTDVTAAINPGNCKCLGSIVSSGNKLIFVPSKQ